VISYSGGSVTAGAVCTVMVDVVVAAAGMYINTSGELTSSLGNSGTAAAIMRVADNSLVLSKRFVSGPVLPGGNVILRYTIENRSDVFTVVQIAFSDDLDQALTGLARVSTESVNSCGSAVVITGTTTLTFGNGSLPPGAICVFDILVAVPADAVAAAPRWTCLQSTSSSRQSCARPSSPAWCLP
jgi:hypothetical protein